MENFANFFKNLIFSKLRLRLNRGRDTPAQVETDGIAYFFQGNGKLILDGLNRQAQHLGYFPVFKPVVFYQFEDHFAFRGELIDCFLDQRQHIGGDQQLLGIEIDTGEFGIYIIDGMGRGPFLFVQVVERNITGGHIEIYPEVFYFFQFFPSFPELDENIRNDLFRGFPGWNDGPGKAE